MPVETRNHKNSIVNRLEIRIHHFAVGTWPSNESRRLSMPLNRWLMIVECDPEEESFVRDDLERSTLEAGCSYFIPLHYPVEMHLAEKCRFISIQFCADFGNGMDLFADCRRFCMMKSGNWQSRAMEAFESEGNIASALILRAITAEFTLQMMQAAAVDKESVEGYSAMNYALDGIRSQCSAQTTVSELAEHFGVSRETFTRTFTARNGISPKQFIAGCLLQRAYSMLAQGEARVKEIARELGFANEFYFSRFFKKHTGSSPSQYRRRMGGA